MTAVLYLFGGYMLGSLVVLCGLVLHERRRDRLVARRIADHDRKTAEILASIPGTAMGLTEKQSPDLQGLSKDEA